MSINLPLKPHEEALLFALAQARGVTAADLVLEAIEKMLGEVPANKSWKQPTRSLRGLFSIYGAAPSAEEIDESRAEMSANFPRADF